MPEVLQAVTAIAAAVSAVMAYLGKRYARRGEQLGRVIEDAVNHRHRKLDPVTGEAQPRLFDIAVENRQALQELTEWRTSYTTDGDGLLDTGAKVRRFVRDNEADHQALLQHLEDIRDAIDEHVEWETTKYEGLQHADKQ